MNKKRIWIIILSLIILAAILFALFKGGFLTGRVIDGEEDYTCKDCNVIMISIDTLRADHLPCYGYEKETAPNICNLAKDSVLFENSYSASAWTFPSHYAMFTSLYPSNNGLFLLQSVKGFNSSVNSLPKIMKEEGYQTAGFTGGVFVTKKLGFANGFDLFQENKKGTKGSFWDHEEGMYNWLYELNQSEPFFLFLHGYDAHTPYKVPVDLKMKFFDKDLFSEPCIKQMEENLNKANTSLNICTKKEDKANYMKSQYDAEIYNVDLFVGDLISELKKNNLYDKTIIIITADHGDGFGEHNEFGHVSNLYQEQIKIPLIIHVPNKIPQRIKPTVSNIDILPTIMELTDNPDNINTQIDGKSLVPLFHGAEGRNIFSLTGTGSKDKKTNKSTASTWFSLVKDNSKLILANIKNNNKEEFFDLSSDSLEKKNLINDSEYAERLDEMKGTLSDWMNNIDFSNKYSESDLMQDEDFVSKLKALGYMN